MTEFYFQICACYVWPTPVREYRFDHAGEAVGRCGRCNRGAVQLSPLIQRHTEALAIFKERNGRLPEPMGDIPWWDLPFWANQNLGEQIGL